MAAEIKVWVKIDHNEPEKVEIPPNSDIDDLKNELFITNKEEKRKYYGIYNNERLSSSTRVPNNTTSERPILFLKIDQHNTIDNDTTRVTTTHLNAVSNESLPAMTSQVEDVDEIKLSTTPLETVVVPTINTTIHHLPLHLIRTIHYKNGDKYVGEINIKEEPHGKGTMSWKNGRRYEGQWINGKKDGEGIEYGANGAVNFSGIWQDDVLVTSHQDD